MKLFKFIRNCIGKLVGKLSNSKSGGFRRVYLWTGTAGIATIVGLLFYLQTLGLVISSPDVVSCDGNVCESILTIRNPTGNDIDIYNRLQVQLDFSPEIKWYEFYVEDGSCKLKKDGELSKSSTGVACGKAGWRWLNFTDETKPRSDRVYVYRFAKYSSKQYLLRGEKNSLFDKVKWGMGIGNDTLDPLWETINHFKGDVLSTDGTAYFSVTDVANLSIDKYFAKSGDRITFSYEPFTLLKSKTATLAVESSKVNLVDVSEITGTELVNGTESTFSFKNYTHKNGTVELVVVEVLKTFLITIPVYNPVETRTFKYDGREWTGFELTGGDYSFRLKTKNFGEKVNYSYMLNGSGYFLEFHPSLDDSLVAYWDGSGTGNTSTDIFGNYDGAIGLNVERQTQTALNGNYFRRLARSDTPVLTITDNAFDAIGAAGGESWTLSFWMNTTDTTEGNPPDYIVDKECSGTGCVQATPFVLGTGNDSGASGNLIWMGYGSGRNSVTNNILTLNGWHLVILTSNSSGGFYYIDGQPSGTKPLAGGVGSGSNAQNLTFGCNGYTTANSSTCAVGGMGINDVYLDEISFWSRSFDQSDVSNLYYNGTNGTFCTGDPCSYTPAVDVGAEPLSQAVIKFPIVGIWTNSTSFNVSNVSINQSWIVYANNTRCANYTGFQNGSMCLPFGTETDYNFSVQVTNFTHWTLNSSVVIHHDNHSPEISFSSLTPANGAGSQLTSLVVDVSYTEGNNFSQWITFNGTKYYDVTMKASNFTRVFTGLPSGTYSYSASMNDSVGQGNVTESRTLVVRSPPELWLNSLKNNSLIELTSILNVNIANISQYTNSSQLCVDVSRADYGVNYFCTPAINSTNTSILGAVNNVTHSFNGTPLNNSPTCVNAGWSTNTGCTIENASLSNYSTFGELLKVINLNGQDISVYNTYFSNLTENLSWSITYDAYYSFNGTRVRIGLIVNNASTTGTPTHVFPRIYRSTNPPTSLEIIQNATSNPISFAVSGGNLTDLLFGWHTVQVNYTNGTLWSMRLDGNIIMDYERANGLGYCCFYNYTPSGIFMTAGGWSASSDLKIGNVSLYYLKSVVNLNSFDLNITNFLTITNNESQEIFNLSYDSISNQTFYVKVHQFDNMLNFSINLTGHKNITNNNPPTNVKVYLNNTLTNSFDSIPEGSSINLYTFNDSTNNKSSIITKGQTTTQVASLRILKDSTVTLAKVNITGSKEANFLVGSANLSPSAFEFASSVYIHDDGANDGWIEENYTKSYGGSIPLSAIWTVKHDNQFVNYDVPTTCFDYFSNTIMVRVQSHGDTPNHYTRLFCFDNVGATEHSVGGWRNIPYQGDCGYGVYNPSSEDGGLKAIDGDWNTYSFFDHLNKRWYSQRDNCGGFIYETKMQYYFNGTPSNVTLEVGVSDGTSEWSSPIGYFNGTMNTTGDFSSVINTYLTNSCVEDSQGYCNVPIYVRSDTPGRINLSNVNVTYTATINPISINVNITERYLRNTSNNTVIPIKIENSQAGTKIQVSGIRYAYLGGNQTYNITVHDSSNSVNDTRNATFYYSSWRYDFPKNVQSIDFAPGTSSSKNVTPFGQTSTVPILNLTGQNYGGLANFSIIEKNKYGCVVVTVSNTSSKNNGQVLTNNSWNTISNRSGYLHNLKLWMWADYTCTLGDWFNWYLDIQIKACQVGSICSNDTLN